MDSPSLAILIPAFNQPSGAIATVEFASRHRANFPFLVEVLLSDNYSEDAGYLDELVRYESEGWLSLFRQKENLGFSANVHFLATKAKADFSLILGCGDLPHLSNLGETLGQLVNFNPLPALVVGTVTSHDSESTFRESESTNFNLVTYKKSKSLWAPYQEAISGQLYSSSFLRNQWPLVAKSGNAWPHIEASLQQAVLRHPSILRVGLPIASIHQDFSGWYFEPGANSRHLAKHLAILMPVLFVAGVSVMVKAVFLIFRGLPRAIAQDIEAFIRKRLG